MRGRLIAVEGASASGKTTAAVAAASRLGAAVVPEAFRRLQPAPSLEVGSGRELRRLEEALLAEESRRFVEARDLARAGGVVLLDTGSLGPLTYTAGLVDLHLASARTLRAVVERARRLAAEGRWGVADGYVYLRTSPDRQYARARTDPLGHPVRLAARHIAVGAIERRFYEERFAPMWVGRFRSVGGNGPPDDVARRLALAVRSVAGAASRRPPVGRVLRLFARTAERRPSLGNR